MRRRRWNRLPAKVAEVREQLESWRQTRQKRSPIPAPLWEAAAALAREHGLHRVAKALGLNYPDLKRRLEAAPPPDLPEKIAPPTFVEMACVGSAAPAPCVIEVENRAGVRMRISLSEPSGADLAALIEAFGSGAG